MESASKGDCALRQTKDGLFSKSKIVILKTHVNDEVTYWKDKDCKGTVTYLKETEKESDT